MQKGSSLKMMNNLSIAVILLVGFLCSPHVQGAPISNGTISVSKNTTSNNSSNQEMSQSATLPQAQSRQSGLTNSDEETGGNEQQDSLQISDIARTTITAAGEVGTRASLAYTFILTNYLEDIEPPPAPPCFSEERGAHELDQHIHPDVDYTERLLQDYTNLLDYLGYLETVQMDFNSTLQESVCGYCLRFNDLKQSTMELKRILETLIQVIQSDALSSNTNTNTINMDSEKKKSDSSSNKSGVDDPCQITCFDQQARTYLRYQIFTAIYIVNDVNGLQDQIKS